MNERIQELAWEAEDYADSIVNQGGGFHQAYTRKFAELIVKECANRIDYWESRQGEHSDDFLKHFGVGE